METLSMVTPPEKQRQLNVSDFNFAAEGGGKIGLEGRLEAVHVDDKRESNDAEDQ